MIKKIAELLEKDGRYTAEQIATMIGKNVKEVADCIEKLETDGVIVSYGALINDDKLEGDALVTALIEVKITPQEGQGYFKIAKKIYYYPQVRACYLMSGGFDLTVIIEGKTLKEVAIFVAEKLAPIEGVIGTATHFLLQKYKENGVEFEDHYRDDREAVIL
jgi:DNA-binding Lrp family transcriptional regulator